MSCYIGYGHRGLWLRTMLLEQFLDWYAERRCQPGDERHEWCTHPGNRWGGVCLELGELIPEGEVLGLTTAEREEARATSRTFSHVLSFLDDITTGVWQHDISSDDMWYRTLVVWVPAAVPLDPRERERRYFALPSVDLSVDRSTAIGAFATELTSHYTDRGEGPPWVFPPEGSDEHMMMFCRRSLAEPFVELIERLAPRHGLEVFDLAKNEVPIGVAQEPFRFPAPRKPWWKFW